MSVLQAGETLIAHESDVTAGELSVNDAYDLYLVKLSSGNYRLIIHMKLQFFFVDSGSHKWAAADKPVFVTKWRNAVKQRWGNRVIKSLANHKNVELDLRFTTQIGGWMFDHWEITVKKIAPGEHRRSSVSTTFGNVRLDSEDLTLAPKGHGQTQRGVVHEFGHMLGIKDEYKHSSPHKADYSSIMNRGEVLRVRHDATYIKWLNKKLTAKGIN